MATSTTLLRVFRGWLKRVWIPAVLLVLLTLTGGSAQIAPLDLGGWRLVDIGAPGTVQSASFEGGCFDLAIGPGSFDVQDQAAFLFREVRGDAGVEVQIEAAEGTGYPAIGIVFRESLGPGSPFAGGMLLQVVWWQARFYFRLEENARSGGDVAVPDLSPLPRFPNIWLRTERRGDTILGFYSVDRMHWIEFARRPLTAPVPDVLFAGVVAAGYRSPLTTRICNLQVVQETDRLPVPSFTVSPEAGVAPLQVDFDATASTAGGGGIVSYSWTFGDGGRASGPIVRHTYQDQGYSELMEIRLLIDDAAGRTVERRRDLFLFSGGRVGDWQVARPYNGGEGMVEEIGNCLRMSTTGIDVITSPELATFAFQEVRGDFRIECSLGSVHQLVNFARAGLMFRESLHPSSRYGYAMVYGVLSPAFTSSWRLDTGGETDEPHAFGRAPDLPRPASTMAWLRLERRGSVVTGSYANEGTGWTEFVSRTFDPPLAETLLVGAAAGSHSISGAYTTTDACEIEIVREPEGGATFRRGDGDGDGRVNLTDAVFTLNFLFLGGASPACHDAADADDDGMLNVTDAVIELNFLFLGGPDLAAPGTRDCGRDGDGSDRLRACVDRSCSRG